MPPAPAVQSDLPVMQIGYNAGTQQWTLVIQTKLTPTSTNIFSEAYLQVDSTATISNVTSTGFWPSDKTGRPTLLMKHSGGYIDNTAAAGLDTPVQCVSATAGDFDNDMDVDLYLACRTGASNIPNILYENLGDGTFSAVPNAGGAAGPVGIAVASGAGTADSAVAGDYDVDGFLDLFVTNGFNLRPLNFGGPNKLFRNNGNGNHWIELDLVGTASDRDAVGARVYATANGITQLRVQNGQYHRWSQDAKRSHFGLAGASLVNLRVEWPSGNIQTFNNVAADTAVPGHGRRRHRARDARRGTGLPVWSADDQQCGRHSGIHLARLSDRRVAHEDVGGWRQHHLYRQDHFGRQLHERQGPGSQQLRHVEHQQSEGDCVHVQDQRHRQRWCQFPRTG